VLVNALMTDNVNSAGTCSEVVCLPAAGVVGAWARLLLTYFAVAYDQVVFAIRTKTVELTFLLTVYSWSKLTKKCLRV
jgi:ABC-type branched-subunit amino acid transport system permease subunit